MRAIIFGAGGQDGYYLSSLLAAEGVIVTEVARSSATTAGDVSDYEFVTELVKKIRPNYVFHLAANSTTRHEALFENHAAISTGTLNVLESARLHTPDCKIFLAGSAMQFKNEGSSINEKTPFEASSLYSVARIQSVYAARYYRERFGLRAYVGYLFNHDSPLRAERHINQKVAAAAKRIAAGSSEQLVVGDWDVEKEFNFAGDIVNAIWLLVNQEKIFEVVIGCGEAHSIKEWIEYCFAKVHSNWRQCVTKDAGYKSEYKRLVSDNRMLCSLGWQPKVTFEQLADMMLAVKASTDK